MASWVQHHMTGDEFRQELAAKLDELAGDEGRLLIAIRAWWRRVTREA